MPNGFIIGLSIGATSGPVSMSRQTGDTTNNI